MLRQRIAFFGLIALSSCGGDASSKRDPAGSDRDAQIDASERNPDASKRDPAGSDRDAQIDSNGDASERNPDASEPESKPDSSTTGGQPDAAAADGGSTDAGATDAAVRDAGSMTDDCPTIELDYAGFGDGFFAMNCRSCHSASRTGSARMSAPADLNFDSEAEIGSARDRIRKAAVVEKRMPPAKRLSDCSIERLAGYLDRLTDPACTPDCSNKQCGDDGCAGSCGPCAAGSSCDGQGTCACVRDCQGKSCGGDGCGGSCGTCAAGASCDTQGSCVCAPDCQTCSADGTCSATAIDFATDVYPIFAAANCGNSNCHGGGAPARSLNLSSASVALANLVGVAADECGERLRVAPGAPESSYLVNKLTGVNMCSGERMPRGGAALPAGQIDTVRAWITSLTP